MPMASQTFDYANMGPNELEAERALIVAKAAGDWESLDVGDLQRLSALTNALRRRTAGPPKAAKAAAKPRGTKKKADAAQVLMDI